MPGLSLEQSEPGVGRLVLRGVNTGGVASTVAVYVDETPFGSSSGLVNGAILAGDFDTFDIARIEVLRGPQGTLYGASSLGGVLKFVTIAPQLGEMTARARAGLEFVDDGNIGYNTNAVLNAPLGEKAALRATGFYRKNAGWVDAVAGGSSFLGVPSIGSEDINESEVYGGRISLLLKPSEPLTVRLTAIAQHIDSDASSDVEVDPDDYDPIGDELTQSVFLREPNELEYRVFNATLDYDLGFASLLSSSSWAQQDQTFRTDLTQTFGSAINFFFGPLNPGLPGFPAQVTTEVIAPFQDQQTDLKKFTQEIRLVSPSNDVFEWLVGGYFSRERGKIDQLIAGQALASGLRFTDPVLGSLATARITSRYREIAGFANATWHITDRFDLTAGGRLSQNKQSAIQSSAGVPVLVPGGGATFPAIRSKESVFTYSVSPRFEISDTTAVYARVAKGYRPGGPNVLPPTAGPDVPRSYDADTITSYELGLKSDIGRRLSLDLSAYHLKWKDIQLFTQVDNFGVNINGTGAESNGIEGSLAYRPMRGLSLGLNGAFIDAELTGDTPPLVGGFEGDDLPYVPKLSFSVTGDYDWRLSPNATAFVGGTLSYTGKQKDNFQAGDVVGVDPATGEFIFAFTPQRRIPDYTSIDLRAGIDFGRFTAEAFVRNLTNSRGVTSLTEFTDALTGGNPLPGGAIRASFIQPRTIGVTIGAEF